jgi:hypothetical protein
LFNLPSQIAPTFWASRTGISPLPTGRNFVKLQSFFTSCKDILRPGRGIRLLLGFPPLYLLKKKGLTLSAPGMEIARYSIGFAAKTLSTAPGITPRHPLYKGRERQ